MKSSRFFTLCSLISLNSKHFPSESSACQIPLAFLLSQGWVSFDINILIFFQYNLVCFDFVQASSSKKLCLILFDSLYSETFDGNFVLCNTLYTGERGVVIYDCNSLLPTRVIALQVVRTSFLGPTPSYFPLPLLVSTLFM